MQKVYLLLRNNQQTGPFNLEDLIKFDLKPFDLIWIEGKSAGWYYPQEIKALHPYLPFVKKEPAAPTTSAILPKETTEKSAPKKVFVSMPATSGLKTEQPCFLETTNDLHERYKPGYSVSQRIEEEAVKTNYNKPLEEVELNYADWIYKQKTKKKNRISRKGLVAACLIVTVAFAGWLIIKKVYDSDDRKTETKTTQSLVPQSELAPDTISQNAVMHTVSNTPIKKAKQNKPLANNKPMIQTKSAAPSSDQTKTAVAMAPTENDYGDIGTKKEEAKTVVVEKKSEPVAEEAPKEKKKLRDKILDIFKKKPSEKKNEEAKPVEEENGERRSTRREADASLAQMVSLNFSVPNDWMMGIKGAKATLNNRSSETIAKATVEVLYYNDDNEILDKKTISFSNIGGKKSQTVSIPDHSSATRLEYKIISVTGSGEPFAKL